MTSQTPTDRMTAALTFAYGHFNATLFANDLPPCLLTLQRRSKTRGYFSGERFELKDGSEKTDEIALNPQHFRYRTTEETLSTLVHEMAHLWVHHFAAKKPKGGYHCKQWATKMREVGLIPTDTGLPGGKETGAKVTHCIEPDGRFQRAYRDLEDAGFPVLFVDRADESKAKAKAASKTKYTCGGCDANAWAKPESNLVCGDCEMEMEVAS